MVDLVASFLQFGVATNQVENDLFVTTMSATKPKEANRMKNKFLFTFLAVITGLALFSTAHARSSYRTQFNTTYPASTAIGTCTLCHPGGDTGSFNGYADAFSANNNNYRAIETLDSDGDGFSNITEINALTFPGDATSRPAAADTTAPTVAISAPATNPTSVSSTPIAFSGTASDNVGVSQVRWTNSLGGSGTAAGTTSWSASIALVSGANVITVTARDAAGNTATASRTVNYTPPPVLDTTPPTVASFSLPATSTLLTVPITSFVATDDVGVIGLMVTESAVAPAASAAGWSASAPASYTFTTDGARTLYAWAKDAAGNVSAGRQASALITLPPPPPPAPTFVDVPNAHFAFQHIETLAAAGITSGCQTDDLQDLQRRACAGPVRTTPRRRP